MKLFLVFGIIGAMLFAAFSFGLTSAFAQDQPASSFGLIPCAIETNNDDTPWDDTEPCGLKHTVLLIKLLIDFMLLKAVPVILVLMVVYTGVIFYFSPAFGGPEPLTKVKSLWRSVGVGLIILLLSWTFINMLLGLLGYDINIFGRWEEIEF
ncbi:MAG: hypothetical protein HYV77_02120 [Candidatus Wildermuthbacteria bacterium]|nr:hypothetical protein [Candidatus Wildermuthbacteria bacterium]